MKLSTFLAVVGLAAVAGASGVPETARALIAQTFDTGPARATYIVLAQSDVYVTQAKGRLSGSALPPLGRAPVASHGVHSVGMYPGGTPRYTCTWVNATSPHCYAATQQGRPLSK